MKQFFITSAFVFISLITYAQDQKWSVEANYPLNLTSGSGVGEMDGVIDFGIKYRFVDLGPIRVGAGLNTSYLRNYDRFTFGTINGDQESELKRNNILIQPKLFGETSIPGIARIRTQFGIGYSILIDDFYFRDGNDVRFDNSETDGGLNLNLGLSYDISKRLFVQLQYDYLRLNRKGNTALNGQSYPYSYNEDVGLVKAGIGFRF